MPRRRPAAVRFDQEVARALTAGPVERLPGLSPRGQRILDRLEVDRRWPGSTAAALRNYRRFLTDPAHRLWDDSYGCGIDECCPQPPELRAWLELVVRHLPRRDRRGLEAVLTELDDLW